MEQFLTKLYSYEYFSTYLIISIIVLLILFVVILFFGKKDKKEREIEATKKLNQINTEEIGGQGEAVKTPEQVLENDTIIVPNVSEIAQPEVVPAPSVEVTPLEPVREPAPVEPIPQMEGKDVKVEPVVEETPTEIPTVQYPEFDANVELSTPVTVEEIAPIENTFKEESPVAPVEIASPVFESSEEKPFQFEEFSAPVVEPDVATVTPTEAPAVPDYNFDEIVKNVENVAKTEQNRPEIFSSVFIPEKEEEHVNESNEEDIELPSLKKEVDESSKLNSYNLDDISGETYDIR